MPPATRRRNGSRSKSLEEFLLDDEVPQYLIRDRDAVFYGAAITRRLRAMGIRDKPIAPGSPWQNTFAERMIGTIRRECVDHVITLGERHLRRIPKSYASYYNAARTHRYLLTGAGGFIGRSPRPVGRLNYRENYKMAYKTGT